MKYLAVHETLVARTSQPQIYAVNKYQCEKFNSLAKSGWYITYNEFVDVDGTRTKIRPFGEETVAVIHHNCATPDTCDTYSVCFALSGDIQTFNVAQIKAWQEIVKEHPEAEITLHRNLQANRTCPGKLITVDYLKNLLPSPDKTPIADVDKVDMAQYMSILDYAKKILTGLLSTLQNR